MSPRFAEALAGRGVLSPTPIQALVFPRLLAGESLFFTSATGTGKTFAYLIPAIERLLTPPAAPAPRRAAGPRTLIAAPTYELCSQIKAEADSLLEQAGALSLKTALLIGGGNIGRQIDGLRKEKPDIIIGNPGRVIQIARAGKLRLGNLECLVLDEADRLVSDDLAGETGELLSLIRPLRRSGEGEEPLVTACSATLSAKTREKLLGLFDAENPPVFPLLELRDNSVLGECIRHWAIFSERRKKIDALRSFLAAAKPRKALVFTARTEEAGKILSRLQYHHIAAAGLSGGMDKSGRKRALDDFRKNRVTALVASDLAARGLDIDGISHIIALDVPQNGDAYIHRAGRTGRAGKAGIMLTIGDAGEMRALARLEKKLGIVIYPKELRGGRIAAPESAPR
jgi:superfamily II DNA/RNA helicase